MSNVPLGLLFSMVNNNDAMRFYSELSNQEKQKITDYIQNVQNSEDTKEKIQNAIECLAKNDMTLFN